MLRIESPRDVAAEVQRQLVPLYGFPPTETQWYYSANTYVDSRNRTALTLQLRSERESKDDLTTDTLSQDAIRGALWQTLGDLVRKEDLPEIAFDECNDLDTQDLSVVGIINLRFTSSDAFHRVRRGLGRIELAGQGVKSRKYIVAKTSSLAGDVFIFDCLNLRLQAIDIDKLFQALTDMTKELGYLMGLAKIVVRSNDSNIPSLSTVRGYVKLSQPWLGVSLRTLVDKLPYRLLWYGIPYPLIYAGYDQRSRKTNSKDYPLESERQLQSEAARVSAVQNGDDGAEAPP